MEQSHITKNDELLNIAKILRRNMTRQEKHLWYDFLQHYPVKIYKQRIIDNFVVDFYCHKARLAIEIDGSQHFSEDGMQKDNMRSDILEKYGIKVVRFSNKEIDDNFEGVCYMINKTIQEHLHCKL